MESEAPEHSSDASPVPLTHWPYRLTHESTGSHHTADILGIGSDVFSVCIDGDPDDVLFGGSNLDEAVQLAADTVASHYGYRSRAPKTTHICRRILNCEIDPLPTSHSSSMGCIP